MRIVVIGGGITGLTLAWRLLERTRSGARPLEVTVLEAAARAGGHATTLREDGFVVETGPNAFLDRPGEPQARALVAALGLEAALETARPAARRRYVLFGG